MSKNCIDASNTAKENTVIVLARDSQEELISALQENNEEIGNGRFRLALFNPTEKRKELAIRVINKGIEWKDRQDLWFSSQPLLAQPNKKLAFVFPGLDVPAVNGMNAADATILADYTTSTLSKNLASPAAKDERKLGDYQLLIDASLKKLGINPDVVAGHSLGEWTAARSIGVIENAFMNRLDHNLSERVYPPIGVSFLSVSCAIATLQNILKDEKDVFISNDNCNQQVVVSAKIERAKHFQEILSSQGIVSHILPFETGYHSPYAEIYVQGVKDALTEPVNVNPPCLPIWSCITAQCYEEITQSIEQSFINFITQPVRFREMILNMYEQNVRTFVQVGEGALSGFIANILHDRPFSIVTAGNAKRDFFSQFQRVIAALFVDGKAIDISMLNIQNCQKMAVTNIETQELNKPLANSEEDLSKKIGIGEEIIGKNIPEQILVKNKILSALELNIEQINKAQVELIELINKKVSSVPLVDRFTIEKKIHFTLDNFPYLIDHSPFRKVATTDNFDNERQAIVPFTFFLDLITELFIANFPGLQLTTITSAQVNQFLWLHENREITLLGVWQTSDTMKFTLGDVFEAVVSTQSRRSHSDPIIDDAQQLQPPVIARELYVQGYMFQGALFQGIKEFISFSDYRLDTLIKGISIKGALLDNMGQTAGLLNHFIGKSVRSFPVSVERVEFYQSPIDQMGDFYCSARVISEDEDFCYSNIDLSRDGKPWCKFFGWKTKKSDLKQLGWELLANAEGKHLARKLGEGVFLLESQVFRQANSWFIMSEVYLNSQEKTTYQTLAVAQKKEYLLTRIAAKDAVRDVILMRYGCITHPASFNLEQHDQFFTITHKRYESFSVDLAYENGHALAQVGECSGVGVGICLQVPKSDSIFDDALLKSALPRMATSYIDNHNSSIRQALAKKIFQHIQGGIPEESEEIKISFINDDDIAINKKIIRTIKYKQYIIAWLM